MSETDSSDQYKEMSIELSNDKKSNEKITNCDIKGYKIGDEIRKNANDASTLMSGLLNDIYKQYPDQFNKVPPVSKYLLTEADKNKELEKPGRSEKFYVKVGDNLWVKHHLDLKEALNRMWDIYSKVVGDSAPPVTIFFTPRSMKGGNGGESFTGGSDEVEIDDSPVESNGDKNSGQSVIVASNLIISGVPGSGKSYFVDTRLVKAIGADKRTIRTIFHPEYTNSDFIGQLRPSKDECGNVTYSFFPGPFTVALITAFEAYRNVQFLPVALIIEELNRGDCAAIFGEAFQLLDRKDDGSSEYEVISPMVSEYLFDKKIFNPRTGEVFSKNDGIYIPSNLFLVATMNASDQNIFPLDTAFNRRWRFIRYPNEFTVDDDNIKDYLIPGYQNTWGEFVDKVNKIIVNPDNHIQNCEDKQLGVFFVGKNMLCKKEESNKILKLSKTIDSTDEEDARLIRNYLSNPGYNFAYKVLGYLWNDISRTKRNLFFKDRYDTLESVVNAFVKNENPFNFDMKPAGDSEPNGENTRDNNVSIQGDRLLNE